MHEPSHRLSDKCAVLVVELLACLFIHDARHRFGEVCEDAKEIIGMECPLRVPRFYLLGHSVLDTLRQRALI